VLNVPCRHEAGSTIQRLRRAYRRTMADRVDRVFAAADPREFADCFEQVWPELQWDHRPSARRLYALAREGPGDGAIVEIGSYLGNSTIYLAAGSMAVHREEVHAVDPHTEQSMTELPTRIPASDTFLENLSRFGVREHVVYHRRPSSEAARLWDHGPVRLLYIDGLHTYESVIEDMTCWRPHLAADHVVVFDEYLWPEVERAVQEIRSHNSHECFALRGGQALLSTRPLSIRVAGLP
jgi:predicted O-methyltransferase YrrM